MALPNLSQISEALDKIMPELTPVPVGTVAYAHEVPTGWLQCNGAEVSRTTYARLFRKIGTKYGAGNGSTTFNLPDLQHRVLEGTNTTSEVAQKVEAGLPDIIGNLTDVAGGASMKFNGGALHGDVTDKKRFSVRLAMDALRAYPFRRNAVVTLTGTQPQFNPPPCG